MNRLRKNEICPLHHRRDCCGREPILRGKTLQHGTWRWSGGVLRSEDGREKCSPAVLRQRKGRLLSDSPVCAACGQRFQDYRDAELGHKKGKGLGGAFHNDAMSNLILLHRGANSAQGSMDFDEYMRTKWKLEHCRGEQPQWNGHT